MSVTNNSIKIKCNNKELYNFLIQDIRVKESGDGWVVILNYNPANAFLYSYAFGDTLYVKSYVDDFEFFLIFPREVVKVMEGNTKYKSVITLSYSDSDYGVTLELIEQ